MELTNITEWIRCDEILGLLRLCGADERQIGTSGSDYEFFSALCRAMPLLTGHPLKTAIEKALQNELGMTQLLSPDTCDAIWRACADKLLEDQRLAQPTLSRADGAEWTSPAWRALKTHLVLDGATLLQTNASSWSEWEAEMRSSLDDFGRRGGSIVRLSPDAAACAEIPNLYRVEQSLKSGEASPMLTAQVLRFLAVELQKRDLWLWIDTAFCGKDALNLLGYAERHVGLPCLIWTGNAPDTCQAFFEWQSCAHAFEIRFAVRDGISDDALRSIAKAYPQGRLWKLGKDTKEGDLIPVTIYECK